MKSIFLYLLSLKVNGIILFFFIFEPFNDQV